MALGYNVLPVLYSIAGKSDHDVVVPSITESHLASSLGLFPARACTIYLLEICALWTQYAVPQATFAGEVN